MLSTKIRRGLVTALVFLAIFAGSFTTFGATNLSSITMPVREQKISLAEKHDREIANYVRTPSTDEEFEDNAITLILERNADINEIETQAEEIGFKVAESMFDDIPNESETYRQIITLKSDEHNKESVINAIEMLQNHEGVLLAQPNYIYSFESMGTPSDTFYPNQWGLNSTYGIGIESAWKITHGNPNVRVGIFEEGLADKNHKDLQGRILPGNFDAPIDNHATAVAGIISAVTDNNKGIAGISQSPISVFDYNNFVSGINFAINNNIKIINASFGIFSSSTGMPAPANASHKQAIENFGAHGGLLVCSAGNDSLHTDETPHYPSGYGDNRLFPEIHNVISVGALTRYGNRRYDSNYGINSVQIYAPGENVYSTLPNSNYDMKSGTSFAAPHVTGTAALIASKYPDLDPISIKHAILGGARETVIDTPDGQQTVKYLRADEALKQAAQIPQYPELDIDPTDDKWDVKITNTNDKEVTIVYNERMCFEGDAKDFHHLTNLRSFKLSAGGSRTVRVTPFGNGSSIAVSVLFKFGNGDVIHRVAYGKPSAEGFKTLQYNTVEGGSANEADLVPNYLGFKLAERYGTAPYEWDVELINDNDSAVSVTYNSRMCFDDAARNFYGLRHLADVTVPANGSATVRIKGYGTAQFITAAINYSVDGVRYRRITSANGLSKDGTTNPVRHHEVVISCSFPELNEQPEYLTFNPIAKRGFIWYTWDVTITNPNEFDAEVSYNAKLCFEGDGRDFDNLADIVTVTVPALGTKTVTINHNGTAGYISMCINYSYKGYEYRRITYANGIGVNKTNTQKHNEIRFV